MDRKYLWGFSILLLIGLLCCKENTISKRVKSYEQEGIEINNEKPENLLAYLVKDEIFKRDDLNTTFDGVYLIKRGEGAYELKIETKIEPSSIPLLEKYYILFSIYPFDIEQLNSERRKYGFESFSLGIKKSKDNRILIKRQLKTNVKSARAITISIVEYKSKQKRRELVLQNTKL